MINGWYFNDWLYRPRPAGELDTAQGGGVVFRQGAHHFDIARLIGGGLLRRVRASTGVWYPCRPTEGSYTAESSHTRHEVLLHHQVPTRD